MILSVFPGILPKLIGLIVLFSFYYCLPVSSFFLNIE